MYAGGMMQPAHEAIDLMPYAAAVNGALAHHRPAFVATTGEDGAPDIGPKGACSSLTPVTWRIWSTPAVAISPTCDATLRSRSSASIRRPSRGTSDSMEKRTARDRSSAR